MGGTTAKAGVVIDGQPRLDTEFYADRFVDGLDVGGYPIQSPVIDLIEIGAGGGSLAWIDAAGVIKVGPESAGADPGPASYGRGGNRPSPMPMSRSATSRPMASAARIWISTSKRRARRSAARLPNRWAGVLNARLGEFCVSRPPIWPRWCAWRPAARPRSARLRPRRVWRRRSATCGGYRPRTIVPPVPDLQCDWDGARGGASRLGANAPWPTLSADTARYRAGVQRP